MKILNLFASFIVSCSLMFFLSVNVSAEEPKISAIRAMLFYQNTGKFSEDVFTTPSDLWNVSFDYVYSVFVVIETESEPVLKTSAGLNFPPFTNPWKAPGKLL